MKTISCGSRYLSSEMHSSFTGSAQCLGGLVVSACATTQQQWGLMFPIPFLGPTATERWWGAALLQAAAVGLASLLITDTFSLSVAHVHPVAEVSSGVSQSRAVPALHSPGLVEPASRGMCWWLAALLSSAGFGFKLIKV